MRRITPLIRFILLAVMTALPVRAETAAPSSAPTPDIDNPLIGFYCGNLEDHLPWCRQMHLGYSKNRMQNIIIPHVKIENTVDERQITKLVKEIETVYTRNGIIPWLSLSLGWAATGFSSPDDVAGFFDRHDRPSMNGSAC